MYKFSKDNVYLKIFFINIYMRMYLKNIFNNNICTKGFFLRKKNNICTKFQKIMYLQICKGEYIYKIYLFYF